MVTKTDILKFLKNANIKHNDTVLIHTSLKAIGKLIGGADMLINAFCDYLYDGLFIIPTHTWDNVTKDSPYYDVIKTKPCLGVMSQIAVNRKDGIRSLHPTHSIVAFGKRANEYVMGEEYSGSPTPVGGCWARLYDEKAKILLIGVGHDKNTFFHAVDEMLSIPNRLTEIAFKINIKDVDGKVITSPLFHTHYTEGISCCCSEYYTNYKNVLDKFDAVTYSQLGNALVYICDAVKCEDIIRILWENTDHDLCINKQEIPQSYYASII